MSFLPPWLQGQLAPGKLLGLFVIVEEKVVLGDLFQSRQRLPMIALLLNEAPFVERRAIRKHEIGQEIAAVECYGLGEAFDARRTTSDGGMGVGVRAAGSQQPVELDSIDPTAIGSDW